jgi:hypothetical protein
MIGSGARETLRALGTGLSAAAPLVPTWIALKAIARTAGSSAATTFIKALDDGSLPLRTRLTAASALTLSTSTESQTAILRHAQLLDGVRPRLSAELLETIRVRKRATSLMEEIKTKTTWMETEKLASKAIEALGLGHPLVLEIVGELHYGARNEDFRKARRLALMRTADRLSDHTACWDVYRSVAYDLERWMDNKHWSVLRELSAEEANRFEKAVRAATARLDADVSCLQ